MEMDLETVSFFVGHIQERIATGGAFFCITPGGKYSLSFGT